MRRSKAFREYLVGIKGPLTTPIGGGIRSLNVALRQMLDLYVCLRPVRWFKGVPSPVQAAREGRHGDLPREHRGHLRRHRVRGRHRRCQESCSRSCKETSPRHVQEDPLPGRPRPSASSRSRARAPSAWSRAAIEYAIANKRKSVTLVHKGNIMKFTEGAFRDWGYALAEREFADQTYTWEQWEQTKAAKGEAAANAEQKTAWRRARCSIKDAIADITLQQVLTRPEEFDVIATLNLNGDYISDALAAQVGGIGIAPGGNINYVTGHAVFEATHGTAPKYANLDKVNPGSLILSGEMMLRYLGWNEAADLIVKSMDGAIARRPSPTISPA